MNVDDFLVKHKRAPEILDDGADTFRQRNATYGNNYLEFGKVMKGLFPNGLNIEAGDLDGFVRLGLFVHCVTKLARYANSLENGGHLDSAHDLMVYAAMLEEVTPQPKENV